jgi:FtsH-binding integral membrane protein
MVHSALYNRFFDKSSYLGGGSRKGNFISLLNSKKQLLVLVFANLIVQLGITYYTFLKTPANKITGLQRVFIIIATFALLFGIIFIKSPWLKFILFSLFSFLQGLFIASIKNEVNSEMIQTAIMGVISIFTFMFTFGLALIGFGVYLTNTFGFFLFGALLLLLIFQVISMFLGTASAMKKGFAGIGLLLFSIFIVYDTNKMLQRNYKGDFITASMDYYLDILNIFLDLLTLNGGDD